MENKPMTDLVIIRGASGSGKTTYAKENFPDHNLVEADMYFMHGEEYRFDPSKLKQAHEWCQSEVKRLLDTGHRVVVANTFTRHWEMRPYFDLFPNTRVYRMTGEYQNTHGVPVEAVQRMRDRVEDYKGETVI